MLQTFAIGSLVFLPIGLALAVINGVWWQLPVTCGIGGLAFGAAAVRSYHFRLWSGEGDEPPPWEHRKTRDGERQTQLSTTTSLPPWRAAISALLIVTGLVLIASELLSLL